MHIIGLIKKMDRNPIEQQRQEIENIKGRLKAKFGKIFDNRDQIYNEADSFINQLDALEANGLVFDKEKIARGIKEGINIPDKDAFIQHVLQLLEPLFILQVTQPKIFAKAARESVLNKQENIKLSEVLYTGAGDLESDDDRVYVHLHPAQDFMTKDRMGDFNLEIQRGLMALARLLQSHPDKKEIWGNSWIVMTSPRRLEELGFTVVGAMSREEQEEYAPGENRPVGKAFMKREDFLARYGNQQ